MIPKVEFLILNQVVLAEILSFATAGFLLAMIFTPILSFFLHKIKFWKQIKDTAISGEKAEVYYKLHKYKEKRKIPTAAGVLIWGTVAIITLIFNLSRSQTFLPLFFLVFGGFLGLIDDYVNIKSHASGIKGIRAITKTTLLFLISGFGAWWIYSKLGVDSLHIPGIGDFLIGWWYIPLFILVVFSTANAVNITDGLDGLAGGLSVFAFAAFAIIAMVQGNIGIAIFCGTMVGALLAYTWFNIFPARFFMGDTGSIAIGATLGVVAVLTNSIVVLPIIGLVFVIETLSSIIQLFSKKFFKRKVFISAPLHHHLEALGWPETKVTMRLWIVGVVASIIGLIIGLLGRG